MIALKATKQRISGKLRSDSLREICGSLRSKEIGLFTQAKAWGNLDTGRDRSCDMTQYKKAKASRSNAPASQYFSLHTKGYDLLQSQVISNRI